MPNSDVFDYKVLDIGCGPKKVNGAWGIDIHQFDEVNQIVDLNSYPWDLPDNHFEKVYANSIIEHVAYIPTFLNEIHRVSKGGAKIYFVTPHFSSVNSYRDPTHLWHLASDWHYIVTDSYLNERVAKYKHIDTKVTLSNNLFGYITRLMFKIKGVSWWEKKFSFVFRARDIETVLEVVKED